MTARSPLSLAMTAFPLLSLALSCGPSEELLNEKARLETKVQDLEKEKARLEREADSLHAKVRKLEESVSHLERREVLRQLGLEDGQRLSARFETSMGQINCELWPDKAPKTIANFVQLAEGTKEWTHPKTKQKTTEPLYSGTIFHRVIPEFMIQGGDPLGTGSGGPGYEFEDETSDQITFDQPGLLAMANRGPDTNGSQIFITDRATPTHLNGKHTIFGKCENLDVVEAIATTPTGARNLPTTDVVLRRVVIKRGQAR